ncbi:MAG: hypothetical protein QOE05_295 [Actinomycetota bacterium]|nr:hypothetical protein [Actinomycetota bacterium]
MGGDTVTAHEGRVTVLARLRVPDFDRWHAEYSAMHGTRQSAGERGRVLYRDPAAPDTVVVLFRWTSEAAARAYFDGSALAESVGRAGADRPELMFLHRLDDEGRP